MSIQRGVKPSEVSLELVVLGVCGARICAQRCAWVTRLKQSSLNGSSEML